MLLFLAITALAGESVGDIPAGWRAPPTIATPQVDDADIVGARAVARMPVKSLSQRINRLIAARELDHGGLLALSDRDAMLVSQLIGDGIHTVNLLASLPPADLESVVVGGERLIDRSEWTPYQAGEILALASAWQIPADSITALRIYRRSPDFIGIYLIRTEGWIGGDVGWQSSGSTRATRWRVDYYFGGAPWPRSPYTEWESIRTEHILLRHPPDSTRQESPTTYAQAYESAYTHICDVLGIQPPQRPVIVWLYDDDRHAKLLHPSQLNFARPDDWEVHMRRSASPGHEIAHVLLQHAWGRRGNEVMSEGLATWLDGTGRDRREALRRQLRGRPRISLAELVDAFGSLDSRVSYATAACLVVWLHKHHGLAGLRAAYQAEDLRASLEQITGLAWGSIESSWSDWLGDDPK